ncbi:GlcNAc transferase [Heterostelium album PN500]|uniref:protein xylosyltransferase n=1 Tax=Heterostelium pallidum (strain ATCC 26659 / Pp 5 / PN500) TaxID=670386 RepID=D3BCK1_HETP5|nr:GlcNAc transferase [Heterostelium album PN500]EFA80643.1 GlcNAc transferase [Heterostelium album PN500]|eukprot:XP_020432763.1 GlcNAc transferase [Heterostelium album PN500]
MRRNVLINIIMIFICITSLTIITITLYIIPTSHQLKNHNEIAETVMNNYVYNSYVNKYKDTGVKGIHPNKKDHRKPASKPVKISRDLPKVEVSVNNSTDNEGPSEISVFSINCENGGIGFTDKCICSPPYHGDHCEQIDQSLNDPCLAVDESAKKLMGRTDTYNDTNVHCPISATVDCCWKRNKRSSTKVFDQQESTSDHQYLERILSSYGPWNENDKIIIDYLFTQNNNKHYHLKYKKDEHQQTSFSDKPSIAYSINIEELDMERFEALLKVIYRPKHYYIIHIDKRLNDIKGLMDVVKLYNSKSGNIRVLDKRFVGSWGSIASVYYEIASIAVAQDMVKQRQKDAPNHKHPEWSHFINLSLDDFPTKNVVDLERFLGSKPRMNYIEKRPRTSENRKSKTWMECDDNQMINIEYQNTDHCGSNDYFLSSYNNETLVEGSQWHFLSNSFANYLLSSRKSIERLFSMKFTLIPEETFFQLALLESNLSDEWVDYNYRFTPLHKENREVDENDLDFKFESYFTSKVKSKEVRDSITEKHLNFRHNIK